MQEKYYKVIEVEFTLEFKILHFINNKEEV